MTNRGLNAARIMNWETILPFKANDVKKMPIAAIAPAVLTVAGYDPTSGAGTTADLQVFAGYGVAGLSAVTALTIQGKTGVRRVEPQDAGFVMETLGLLADEFEIAGVKIGMLATANLVRAVTKFLDQAGIVRERVVLDPVIRSTSGAELLDKTGVELLREELLPRVGWVTPNVDEAAVLARESTPRRENMPDIAKRIRDCRRSSDARPDLNVVVTGGHLDPPDDFLLEASGRETWFPGRRVEARSIHGTHGTGCVFSSALLCRLVLGDEPAAAVREAKAAVVRRLLGQAVAGGS
jgi:hydroxymethylpyrimidine/phosphomethylpyrimidine kinase